MNWWRQRKLFDVARIGDIRGVIGFLEQRPSRVNTTNIWNQTALYLACENGHTAVAQYLLDNGAHVCRGRTKPLIAAVRYNHYDCVKLLLQYHADPNCHNLRRETPMSIALRKHPGCYQAKLILLLLQYDTIPSASFGDDTAVQLLNHANKEHTKAMQKLIDGNFINLTPEDTFLAAFDFAFKRGSVELAEQILSNEGHSQIEQLYPEAVCYSAKNNWLNILSKLLEKRVDVNALTEGQTPLCAACREGHEYVVSLLLDNGADPNVPNDFGTIARLHLSVDGYDDTPALPAAEKLLLASANINALGRAGTSPLLTASKRGETEIVKLLLSHGANPNTATACPCSCYPVTEFRVAIHWCYPIHAACTGLHYDVVKLLLEYHADVNVRDSIGMTALHCALPVSNRDGGKFGDLIQLLLDAGADVNVESKLGETPFYIACFEGLKSVAKKMLEYGAKVDGNSVKSMPLVAACKNKHMSVVQLLLTNGANPNLREEGCDIGYRRSFPLHIAAAGDNSELTGVLLKHGADVDVADIDGNTALHHAIEYHTRRKSRSPYSDDSRNAMSVVDILLENKPNVNIVNNSGDTPLYLAASTGLLDVVNKMLKECGGNPNKGSPTKCPLVEACLMRNGKLVDVLLKHGADPNLTWTSCDPRSKREIPLFHAVDKGNVDITRSLLKAGADVHAVNAEGKSIVSLATENMLNSRYYRSTEDTRNKLSIVRLLLQRGANVDTIMPHVNSPLYATVTALADARRWGHQYAVAVIELLQLMVKYGAKLQDSCCQTEDNVYLQELDSGPLMALVTFDVRHDFIVELFRAGAGFQLLARCCNAVNNTIPRGLKSVNLCKAAVLAGYVPSAGELQKLQLAAVRDRTAGHLIQQLVNWLNENRQQAPSLLRQCRFVIRRQLAVAVHFQSVLPAIEQLDLPNVIKDYLRFDGSLAEVDLGVYGPTRP